MTPPEWMTVADRIWESAEALDRLIGDDRVSEWTARKIRGLIRSGRGDDLAEFEKLADALERKLERERGGRREVFK